MDEAAREGLALPLDGIEYNVFITRELNPRITPDKSYVVPGTEPDATHTLYGVFLQACNHGKDAAQTADRFKIVDNQGNEFEPEPLPRDQRLRLPAEGARAERVHPRERQRRPARPDGRRPCCCSGCRSRTPRTARSSSRSRARAAGTSRYKLDI